MMIIMMAEQFPIPTEGKYGCCARHPALWLRRNTPGQEPKREGQTLVGELCTEQEVSVTFFYSYPTTVASNWSKS